MARSSLVLSICLTGYLAKTWDSAITPAANWKPPVGGDPLFRIVAILAISVGLPYFTLSTTGPLLQAWYRRVRRGHRQHRDANHGVYRCPAPVPVLFLAAAALLPEAIVLAVRGPRRRSDHFSLFIAAVLLLLVFFNSKRAAPEAARPKAVCAAAALAVTAIALSGAGFSRPKQALERVRNFYGTLSVLPRAGDGETAALTLAHGRIKHGFQLRSAAYRRSPTAYYASGSGLERAFQLHAAFPR